MKQDYPTAPLQCPLNHPPGPPCPPNQSILTILAYWEATKITMHLTFITKSQCFWKSSFDVKERRTGQSSNVQMVYSANPFGRAGDAKFNSKFLQYSSYNLLEIGKQGCWTRSNHLLNNKFVEIGKSIQPIRPSKLNLALKTMLYHSYYKFHSWN